MANASAHAYDGVALTPNPVILKLVYIVGLNLTLF
jgi:hypothetical protein